MVQWLRRWNKWRTHCLNSKLYQLLVLLGLQYSLTLYFTLLDEEEEAFYKAFLEGVQKGKKMI